MHGRELSRRKILRIVLAVIGVAAAFALLYKLFGRLDGSLSTQRNDVDVHSQDDGASSQAGRVLINGKWYVAKDYLDTVLLIGVDDNSNSDFLMVLVRNKNTGEVLGIPINRDTITNVPVLTDMGKKVGSDRTQIAMSYHYGDGSNASAKNVLDAVSYLLYEVDIQNYIALKMGAIPILNDDVGGVTVEGKTLWGDEALEYVQQRYGVDDETNVSRMERQKNYALAWFDKAKDYYTNEKNILKTVENVSDYMLTDLTTTKLQDFAEQMQDYSKAEIISIEGTNDTNGKYAQFYPDEDKLRELVLEVFYDEA